MGRRERSGTGSAPLVVFLRGRKMVEAHREEELGWKPKEKAAGYEGHGERRFQLPR